MSVASGQTASAMDIIKSTPWYAADSVGSDAYAITLPTAPSSYADGSVYRFKAGTANTGASTLNVNSLGAIAIKRPDGADTRTGDILANQIVEVLYRSSAFYMISPPSEPTCMSTKLMPMAILSGYGNAQNNNDNTKLSCGMVFVPVTIKACVKLSIDVTVYNINGTFKIALFSQDGQTKLIDITTATVTGTGLVQTTFSAVDIPAGVYYIAWVPQNASQASPATYQEQNTNNNHPTSEPVYCGYVTVTAGTMPSTITPTSITFGSSGYTLAAQLDA